MGALGDYFNDAGVGAVGDKFSNITDFGSAMDAFSAAADLADDMLGLSPVKLGTFGFADFEVPENVTYASKRNTVLHKHPGGIRTLDDLGADPDPIVFAGILFGANGLARKRKLQKIIDAGKIVKLTWRQEQYQVYVETITWGYKNGQITYAINAIIMNPGSSGQKKTLMGALTQSLGDAIGVDIPGTLDKVSSAVSAIQPVLGSAVNLVGGGVGAQKLLSVVNSASNITNGFSNAANGSIAGLMQVKSGVTSAIGAVSATYQMKTSLSQVVATTRVNNNLTVMQNNLTTTK